MQGRLETRVGIFVIAALLVFIYMGLKVGAFRFDRGSYNLYSLYFKDISGVSRKSEVKIAGVKVGWVEEIDLQANGGEHRVRADIMIYKDYTLYNNACGIVRQEGLLGSKFIEVSAGDSFLPPIEPGGSFIQLGKTSVAIDELLGRIHMIANNVQEVAESFKDAIGGVQGSEKLRQTFENLHYTADNLASLSHCIDSSSAYNQENIDAFLALGKNIQGVTDSLRDCVAPAFQDNVCRISTAIEEVALQARDGMRGVTSIADKIDEGQGLLGKMINEDETYRDLRVAVSSFSGYLTKLERIQVVFDFHSESMHRLGKVYSFENSKGYFNVRVHPTDDYFYVVQLAASEGGFKGHDELLEYSDIERNHEFTKRNTIKVGAQFGKLFGNFALRVGLFEGSAGLGVDINVPFGTNKLRWVTSLEMFDMSGWSRKNDRCPHIKWLNRMFIFNTVYAVFGADDIASKTNRSAFIGVGLRFGDDDVKSMLSGFSGTESRA